MYSLYGKGYTHVVDGVQCQVIRVEERELEHYRSQGWKDDIHSVYAVPVEPKADKAPGGTGNQKPTK